jgi:hypothetical protein
MKFKSHKWVIGFWVALLCPSILGIAAWKSSAGLKAKSPAIPLFADEFSIYPGVRHTTSDGRVTVFVPADTYIGPVASLRYVPLGYMPAPLQGRIRLGQAFALDALDRKNAIVGNHTFTPPVSLTISYAAVEIPAGSREEIISFYSCDTFQNIWLPVPVVARDTDGNKIDVSVQHMGQFVLGITPLLHIPQLAKDWPVMSTSSTIAGTSTSTTSTLAGGTTTTDAPTTSTSSTSTTTTTTLPVNHSLEWLTAVPKTLIMNGETATISITGIGFAPGMKAYVGGIGSFPVNVTSSSTGTFEINGNYLSASYWGGQLPQTLNSYLFDEYSSSDFFFFYTARR